jgi:Fe-S-cluster containining protein|tara:strand:+ start:410 stop:730 length:321 start_codon:yes stop_codon:yes gene_type:complete
MFGKSSRSYVEERGDKVAVVNWCSNLRPDLSCGIYKNRPGMCVAYNCFKAANGQKQLPEYWNHIKPLVERVHGVSPYKRRDEETTSESSDDNNMGSIRTDAQEDGG